MKPPSAPRHQRRGKHIRLTALLAATVLAVSVSPASAETTSDWEVISSEPGEGVYASSPEQIDKEKEIETPPAEPGVEEPGNEIDGFDITLGCLKPTKSTWISYGSGGNITAKGYSKVIANYVPSAYVGGMRFTQNKSRVSWMGSSPYNATSITHTDSWDVDYLSGSVSISSAPSGSVSAGSGRLNWTTTVQNRWWTEHYDDDVRFSIKWGSFNDAEYNVTGQFQFGGSFFRTTAYSHHSVKWDVLGITLQKWYNC